jgi:tellurite resistance protein
MSVINATNAMQAWANASGISAEGRDLSPFVTAATLIALSDQPVTSGECETVSGVKLALTGADLSWEDFQAEAAWIGENGVDGAISAIAENITDDGERELVVKMAALVGVAESGLNAKEGAMLQKIGQGLGFSHNGVLELLGKAMNASSHGTF